MTRKSSIETARHKTSDSQPAFLSAWAVFRSLRVPAIRRVRQAFAWPQRGVDSGVHGGLDSMLVYCTMIVASHR